MPQKLVHTNKSIGTGTSLIELCIQTLSIYLNKTFGSLYVNPLIGSKNLMPFSNKHQASPADLDDPLDPDVPNLSHAPIIWFNSQLLVKQRLS